MTLTQIRSCVGLSPAKVSARSQWAVLAFGLGLASCGASEGRGPYAFLDGPIPSPQSVGSVSATDLQRSLPTGDDEVCGRGRGLDGDGQCVLVPTQERDHTQLVLIPRGQAIIGYIPSNFDAQAARKDPAIVWSGTPPRRQELASFWIDVIEVTRSAYAECVDAGVCSAARCAPGSAIDDARNHATIPDELVSSLPQTCVTFQQAERYCEFRGQRLPTESEWELASRGPQGARYPWGENPIDAIPLGLIPAEWSKAEPSYFGALGMGISAFEWVNEVYEPDAALMPLIRGPFRLADGPFLRRLRERSVELGYEAMGERRVIKGGEAGRRFAGRYREAGDVALAEVSPILFSDRDPRVGFRCAMDRSETDPDLRLALPAPAVPLTREFGSIEMFGGVVEGVNLQEAENFCANLEIPNSVTGRAAWRLPTIAEIELLGLAFRGPGPFHTQDGPVYSSRSLPSVEGVPGNPIWEPAEDTDETDPLAARCVRSI